MAKRAHGEGSITQLPSGKYRGRVSVGGKRLSYTDDTKEAVSEWIRETTGQVRQGLTYEGATVKMGEYLQAWLASKESAIRPSTHRHYKSLIEKYLVPALGDLLVKDIKADRIQHIYDDWIRSGVGPHTVRKAHAVLNQALDRAAQTGLLVKNPASLVDKPRAPHKEMKFWTEGQAGRFLAAARDNRLYALLYMAIVTGARQGELLGLRWPDLDWTRGTLGIRRQLTQRGDLAPLKTKAGNRTLALGAETITVLRAHFDRQHIERQAAGEDWQGGDLIFTSTIGTPMHYKNLIERYFKPLVQAAGVPAIRFHDLRHTAVALMLSNGVPIFTVSRYIGHARASITSDIYGHLVPGAGDQIGAMMDDLVAPIPVKMGDLGSQVGPTLDTKATDIDES